MDTGACAPDRRSRREPSRKARRPRGGDCPTRRLPSRFSAGGAWPWVGVITVVCCTIVLAPQQAFAQDFRITVNFLRLGGPRMDVRCGQRTRLRSDATTTGLLGRATGGPGARRDAGDAVSPGHAAETQERLRRSFPSGIAPEGTVANQIHHSPTPEAHL